MAGKVLNALSKGFAGTVSRSVDEIIESFVNKDTVAIPFGAPVALSSNGVVIAKSAASNAPTVIGVAVRIAKTNDTYGTDDAKYNVNELVDVIKRGTVSVKCVSGTPALGGDVYFNTAGEFTAEATTSSVANTKIANAVWKTGADSNKIAEVALLTRKL